MRLFDSLAQLIQQTDASFILVPGPRDIGGTGVYPQQPVSLPNSLYIVSFFLYQVFYK